MQNSIMRNPGSKFISCFNVIWLISGWMEDGNYLRKKYSLFKEIAGELLMRMGYEKDTNR